MKKNAVIGILLSVVVEVVQILVEEANKKLE